MLELEPIHTFCAPEVSNNAALAPINTLSELVQLGPTPEPKLVLLLAVVIEGSEFAPIATLLVPDVFAISDRLPNASFKFPVLLTSVLNPTAVQLDPVLLDIDNSPIAVLLFKSPVPPNDK